MRSNIDPLEAYSDSNSPAKDVWGESNNTLQPDCEHTWYNRRPFNVMLSYLNRNHNETLLDVGCGGVGANIKYAEKERMLPYACDVVEREMGNIPFEVCPLNNWKRFRPFSDISFDAITMTFVLEHCPNPLELLTNVVECGNDDTVYLLSVPNDFNKIQKKWLSVKGMYDRDAPWYCPPTHFHYFNPDSFTELTKSAGLKPLSMFCNFPLDLMLLAEDTDYYENSAHGHIAGKIASRFSSILTDAEYEELGQTFFKIGVGRHLHGVFKKDTN
ncbi:MAG: class I SAM-dependent methyltransferase [Flavobacteriaceae bacterium TMED42]|nr:MAG: class I SAM-dependent methyltransferase [Flavobacteriaceae bacterium TMED42]|tara:strand:- start:257 stop:1072 length:816 start_codon:yes stop_codon:yes gene_type:complete